MIRSIVCGAALLAATMLTGCGTTVVGKWSATKVPFVLGLTLDTTINFDDKNNLTIDLTANNSSGALVVAKATGLYKTSDKNLELTLNTQIIAKDGSGGTLPTQTADDGAQCITVASALVCFPSPQTAPYEILADKMNITIKYKVGDAAETPLAIQVTKSK